MRTIKHILITTVLAMLNLTCILAIDAELNNFRKIAESVRSLGLEALDVKPQDNRVYLEATTLYQKRNRHSPVTYQVPTDIFLQVKNDPLIVALAQDESSMKRKDVVDYIASGMRKLCISEASEKTCELLRPLPPPKALPFFRFTRA